MTDDNTIDVRKALAAKLHAKTTEAVALRAKLNQVAEQLRSAQKESNLWQQRTHNVLGELNRLKQTGACDGCAERAARAAKDRADARAKKGG